MSDEIHHGGCACGAIRFRTTGRPLRVGLCHCMDCRKAHSAAFASFVAFDANAVLLAAADGSSVSNERVGFWDNGRGYHRHFCRACGSRLHGTIEGNQEIELHLGSFDEPNIWTPSYELWVTRRERWLGQIEGSPTHFEADAPAHWLAIG